MVDQLDAKVLDVQYVDNACNELARLAMKSNRQYCVTSSGKAPRYIDFCAPTKLFCPTLKFRTARPIWV